MYPRFLFKLIGLFIATFALLAISAIGDDLGNTDWSTATPSQIHEYMAANKARMLEERREISKSMAAQLAVSTQTNHDVLWYDIFIRVNDTTGYVYGNVKCVAKAVDPSISQIQVDLFSNMAIDSIVSPAGNLVYTRSGNVVTVTLDRLYSEGEQFVFTIGYHGHPTQGGFQGFSFGTHNGFKTISSLSQPFLARTWWPCKDRMDDKADSFKIAIEVDTSFYVGSNGSLDSTASASANSKVFYYTEHYPMANYLFSVAIAPYTVWHQYYKYNNGNDSMLITHAVYPDQYEYSLPLWGITPNAIRLLAQTFGQYPYLTEKYGHANFNWGGGMEHQTMTSMTWSEFGFSEPVVVHELAHQWVGDMITCESWHDIWLNEGFASYAEALYYLNRDGWSAYFNYMRTMDYTPGGTVYCYDTSSTASIFSNRVYDKGAWVFHMLRGVIGETKFQQVVDTYMSTYRFKWLTSTDFRDMVESVTGEDLDWFFDEWVFNGEYRPRYNWSTYSEPSSGGGYTSWIHVAQAQTTNPLVFKMPVDFVVSYSSAPADTFTLMVDARTELFKINTPNNPSQVALDPNGWVLKFQTKLTWKFHIVATNDDFSEGVLYHSYRDTVEQRGGTAPFACSILSGSFPPGLTIDSSGIISGFPTDTGTFQVELKMKRIATNDSDQVTFSIHIAPSPSELIPGDVNLSWGTPDIEDLSLLVAYLLNESQIPLQRVADVYPDCMVDITDLSYMVAYLTGDSVQLLIGCP
jgi:aminopeptidase N